MTGRGVTSLAHLPGPWYTSAFIVPSLFSDLCSVVGNAISVGDIVIPLEKNSRAVRAVRTAPHCTYRKSPTAVATVRASLARRHLLYSDCRFGFRQFTPKKLQDHTFRFYMRKRENVAALFAEP